MKQFTFTLCSRVDNLELSVLRTEPDGGIRGVIQIVHGMSEYKERYLPFMEYMTDRGFVCVIHDHRGHGKSIRAVEDLGYMYGGGARAMVEDIRRVNDFIHRRYAHKKVILLGHSMGSLAVRTYLKKYDSSMNLVILSGSPSKNPALPVGMAMVAAQKKIFGARHPGRLIETISFGPYALRFKGEKSRFAWTCSDPEVVTEYDNSPLCGFTFSADAYQALFQLMQETYSSKGWNCRRPNLPVLFVSGADDPCMDNIRKFKQAVDHMRHVGYRHVRGKVYPGMRHEILNERRKERVYRDLYLYIRKQLFTE